jgi:hypothetical protein
LIGFQLPTENLAIFKLEFPVSGLQAMQRHVNSVNEELFVNSVLRYFEDYPVELVVVDLGFVLSEAVQLILHF